MIFKIILILFEIGFGIRFDLIGSISASELILLATFPLYIKNGFFKKYPVLKKITWYYASMLLVQIVTEFLVGNTFSNAIKGIAVTVVSYLHFFFLFTILIKDRKLILYILIGLVLSLIIGGSEYSEGSVDDVLAGQGAVFLKFYLINFISSGILILSLFAQKRIIAFLSLILGTIVVILGARNGGLGLIVVGIIALYISSAKNSLKSFGIYKLLFFTVTVGFIFYVLYINQILSGNIKSGNAEQILRATNPYNPFNLLMLGRPETFVGWLAFMDNPLLGYGAWAPDVGFKYHYIQLAMSNADNQNLETAKNIIPAHSVLIGAGVSNGIFFFLLMGTMLLFFLRMGITLINKQEKYLIIIIYYVYQLSWNGLFSPVSHFRISFPIFFSMILVSFVFSRKTQTNY